MMAHGGVVEVMLHLRHWLWAILANLALLAGYAIFDLTIDQPDDTNQ